MKNEKLVNLLAVTAGAALLAVVIQVGIIQPSGLNAKLTNWLYGDGATITGDVSVGDDLTVTDAGTFSGILKGSTLAVSGLNTPLTSDTCTAGQMAGGASYLYFCAATDDWKRVAWTDY